MFQIVGQENFKQWDMDQLVTCDCMKPGDDVVFKGYGKVYETTAFEQGGKVVADVPNFLLQKAGSFEANLGWGLNCHLDCRTTFVVEAREKPADYVCNYNIKQRGGSEIPFFDLVAMGLPIIIPNSTGGQHDWVTLEDADFTEFEKALESGLIRIRIGLHTGEGVAYMTSFCTGYFEESGGVWQFTALGFVNLATPVTFRISAMYYPSNAPANRSGKAFMEANCELLRHLVE